MTPRLHSQLPPGLPPSLQALKAPCYLHRAAQWKTAALLGLALVCVVAGLGYVVWRLLSRGPDAAEIALGVFLLLFFVLLLRPATWRAPVVAAADRQGIFFVGSRESVMVPWHETGPFSIERTRTSAGVCESVIATVSSGSAFWNRAKESLLGDFLLGTEKPPGFLRIPLGNPGIDPELTRASLEALRRMSGHEDAHAGYLPGPKTRAWELVIAGAFLLGVSLFFGAIMLVSLLKAQGEPGIGLAIPLLMAALSIGVIRYGWRRRH